MIGTTLSNEFELDTQPVIQRAEKEQKKIVVPKTLPKRQMAFYEMDEQSVLVRSSFGVLEPTIREALFAGDDRSPHCTRYYLQ